MSGIVSNLIISVSASTSATNSSNAAQEAAIEEMESFLMVLMQEFDKATEENEGKIKELLAELQKIMAEIKALMSSPDADSVAAINGVMAQLNQIEKRFQEIKTDQETKLNGTLTSIGKVMNGISQITSDPDKKLELQEMALELKAEMRNMEEKLDRSFEKFEDKCKEMKDLLNKLEHSQSPNSSGLEWPIVNPTGTSIASPR